MDRKFNVRVYGILIQNNRLLINEELIKGRKIIKLPGGGLDWGEGTIDCLKREWMEELGTSIEVLQHFYTTDFFQASAYDDSQIISIYYLVRGEQVEGIINQNKNELTYWMDLANVSADTFSLGIDKRVGAMLAAIYKLR